MLAQIEEAYPNDVRVVFRHFPLIGTPDRPFHDKASLSFRAAEAAGLQGKFWEMHDLLFERQQEWVSLTPDQFQAWLVARAPELGLSVGRFTADLASQKLIDAAQAAWERGQEIGLPGTPFVLLNDQMWPNSLPLTVENVAAMVEVTLKMDQLVERQFTYCPPMTIDPIKQYVATLHTSKGDIVIELFADKAPLAVNSFMFLARHGWFDGVIFHRVIPGFVAQTGDPSGTGYGGPGYTFKNEISPDLKFDREGIVGMANAGADSNGSQFFITYGPAPNLDGSYTIFGQVIAGMEVVKQLTARDPNQGVDLPPGDVIESVTIEEK